VGDTNKETDRWIDKDSRVLDCISSSDDREGPREILDKRAQLAIIY